MRWLTVAVDCRIFPYVATFEPVKDGRGEYADIVATLELRYHASGEPKPEGFKFVGTLPISDVSVADASGKPMRWSEDAMAETRLSWRFDPPLQDSSAGVIVRFRIKGALGGDKESNRFNAPWASNFRVQVDDVTYRFVFPEGFVPRWVTYEGKKVETITLPDGRKAFEAGRPTPESGGFELTFFPGLVERKAPAQVSSRRWFESGHGSGLGLRGVGSCGGRWLEKPVNPFWAAVVLLACGAVFIKGMFWCAKNLHRWSVWGEIGGSSYSSGSSSSDRWSSSNRWSSSSSSCSSCSSCGGCGG
ncbi:MAG: hypothetical protein HY748_13230 [Elusimicrobia bacterium]|nr:hypothetical protein [Elusimicrobiota bacterium]